MALSKEMCSPIDACYKELYEEEKKYKEILLEKKSVLERVARAKERLSSLKNYQLKLTKRWETTTELREESERKNAKVKED